MTKLTIGPFTIERGGRPFIIAEAGINHNGEMEKAREMVRVAKAAGADSVKFQTFKASEFVGDPNQMFTYQSQGKEVTESMLEMFQRYEFSDDQWLEIKQYCDSQGILFLSTPQNTSDLELLQKIGIDAIKVGSDDFTNTVLVGHYKSTGLPMMVSCGMANLSEIHQTVDLIGGYEGYPMVLLHCTSEYPTPPVDVNLKKIKTLSETFPMLPIGFSDHSQGPLASSLAVAYGACVFEKHFTLDHDLPGPDHWFSEDPTGLNEWISSIRLAHTLVGQGALKPTPKEEKMKVLARRSIIVLEDVAPGETLTDKNIGLRRPGNGLSPSMFGEVISRNALKALKKGSLVQYGDFG